MGNLLIEAQAESKILTYKLDKIRKQIEKRIKIVDPIVQVELKIILDIISKYEEVPTNWKLDKILVNVPDDIQKIIDDEKIKQEEDIKKSFENYATVYNKLEDIENV